MIIKKNKNNIDDDKDLDNLDAEIITSEYKKNYYFSSDIKVFNSTKKGDVVQYQKLKPLPKLKSIPIDRYGAICNELKELYTSVTRARNKLIIYDQNYSRGAHIKNLWKSLNLVEFISEEDFQIEENNNVLNNQFFLIHMFFRLVK